MFRGEVVIVTDKEKAATAEYARAFKAAWEKYNKAIAPFRACRERETREAKEQYRKDCL